MCWVCLGWLLRQLANLEAHYETDETVMAIVGQKVGAVVDDQMINQDLQINVNVGIGATDPSQRMNRLLAGVKVYTEAMSHPVPGLNGVEVGKEIFGMMGYRDGGRFITDAEDPRIGQMKQMIQELQQQLQSKQVEKRADLMETKMQLDSKERMHNKDWVAKINELGAQIELWQAQSIKFISDAMMVKPGVEQTIRDNLEPVYGVIEGMSRVHDEQLENTQQIAAQVAQIGQVAQAGQDQVAALAQQMAARNANRKRVVTVNGKAIPVEVANG